jgi:hypothetical protein
MKKAGNLGTGTVHSQILQYQLLLISWVSSRGLAGYPLSFIIQSISIVSNITYRRDLYHSLLVEEKRLSFRFQIIMLQYVKLKDEVSGSKTGATTAARTTMY